MNLVQNYTEYIRQSQLENLKLTQSLDKNTDALKQIFKDDNTFIVRDIILDSKEKQRCRLFFVDGMVNTEIINRDVVNPLLVSFEKSKKNHTIDFIKTQVLHANDVKQSEDITFIVDSILYGDTVLLTDDESTCLVINTKGWKSRSISEPDEEKILSGPREGFTEAILSNTTLIRRKVKNNDLKFKFSSIGKRSNTKICICFIESLADKKLVEQLEQRLNKIDIDAILDANYLTELIKDNPYSLFDTIGSTEKPDIVAGRLLEGRIALLVDGSPVVLTLPYLFVENFQSDDDYYQNFYFSSIGRILRIISFIFTIFTPALYIGIMAFGGRFLPHTLAISISRAREGVPLPVFAECIIMLFVFEILREAGVRMSNSMGHALSVVGGLVIGQSAVEAKLISAPTVIIIAFAGITGLMLPRLKSSVVILRLVFAFCTSLLGFFGAILCGVWLLLHLAYLNSFGISYTAYMLNYKRLSPLKDTYVRAPWWKMKTRPTVFTKNGVRLKIK